MVKGGLAMRKEIIDFLEDAKKTPKELPHIDYNRHLLAMLEIYRRIDIDRPNVLAQDCFMLLSTYRRYKISFESGTDFMRFGMSAIEMMVSLLISATDQYTQLPDSAINELGLYPFMDGTFGDYIRQHNRAKEIHEQEIAQAQNKADGSTKGTGMGNNTTANPETPPAAQETQNEWLSGKPKEVLDEAVNCGLARKQGDCYAWIEGNQEEGWQVGLYGYFVMTVSEQLNWIENDRIPWRKFKPIFANHDKILGTAKQTVDDYKNNRGIPTRYYKVDNLIKSVFGVEL
jgi:hypothetical protein